MNAEEGYDVARNESFFYVQEGKQKFLHWFERFEDADWEHIEKLRALTIEQQADKVSFEGDDLDAWRWAWDKRSTHVTNEAGEDVLPGDPDWRRKIPYLHKKTAVRTFGEVRANDAVTADFKFGSNERTVDLLVPQDGRLWPVSFDFVNPEIDHDHEYRFLLTGKQDFFRTRNGGMMKVHVTNLAGYRKLFREMVRRAKGCVASGVAFEDSKDLLDQVDLLVVRTAIDLLFRQDPVLIPN
jgi:hypothetical protein